MGRTWRPDFGSNLGNHTGDDRRSSDASANSNGATGATGSNGPARKWWDNYNRSVWDNWAWDDARTNGSWNGWSTAAGAASTSISTPAEFPITRPGPTPTARTSSTTTEGRSDSIGGGGGKGPSEKLIIPSFNGEGESGELGTSARSYLRQIDAWERMTKLAPNQRALVLYQHLEGAAWINAEALNMEQLSASDGVAYLRNWVQQHYLDVEVTSVGRSLSDLFRKLKRRYNQSFRDYTAEFNRLLARVVECGCRLPDVATAWLYVDRASLDEATEVSLLASVGNKYQLLQLQQAAIILDRSMRKPWERNTRQDNARKPQTAHLTEDTEHVEDDDPDDEPPGEDVAGEDGEQLYIAYMTAKARYKDTTKARGVDIEAVKKTAEERIKAAKARSYCSVCHQKGHWHRDACCPKRKAEIHTVNVAHEIDSLSPGQNSGLLAITDSACSKSVVGTSWLQAYLNMVRNQGKAAELIPEREAFRFGASRVYESTYSKIIVFYLGKSWVAVKASVIHGDVPLLLSKPCLAKLGMILDLEKNTADFRKLGIKDLRLLTTPSGHPAVPVCHKGKSPPDPSSLPKTWSADGTEILAEIAEAYMIFSVGDGVGSYVDEDDKTGFHRIFYEKKLDEAARESTAVTRLCGLAAASSIESDLALFYFPRRGMSNSTPAWKMNKTELLAECSRRSLAVSSKWTLTELRHVLAGDTKHYLYRGPKTEVPKSISKMTRDELVEEAIGLGIEVGHKETRGSIMLKIRDFSAPDDTVMTIGRFRGETYMNIPTTYADWASDEERANGDNMHPELKRFVIWKRNQKVKEATTDRKAKPRQRGYLDVEDNAMIPPPPVSETGDEHETYTETPRGGTIGLSERCCGGGAPAVKGSPTGNDVSCEKGKDYTAGHATYDEEISKDFYPKDQSGEYGTTAVDRATYDKEISEDFYPKDQTTVDRPTYDEEISEDFYPKDQTTVDRPTYDEEISEDFYPKDQTNVHGVYMVAKEGNESGCDEDIFQTDTGVNLGTSSPPTPSHEVLYTKDEAQDYLAQDIYLNSPQDTSEEMAQAALHEGRFKNKDLEEILDACNFHNPKKRPGVHGEGEERRCVIGYYAYGKFHGVTRETGARSKLAKYINQFLLHNGQDASPSWTSLSITYNTPSYMHTDKNNLPGSDNTIWTGGEHRGGELWVAQSRGETYRQDTNGEPVPGNILETKGKVTRFNPKHKHASEPWQGNRWSVVAYVARSFPHASKTSKKVLQKLQFPVPNARDFKDFHNNNLNKGQQTPTEGRPRRTTQRALWKNAAALCVMTATSTTTMDLYARDYVEPRVRPKVALLEIGGVEATCYATGVCNDNIDVAEPLFYNDLQWAERMQQCLDMLRDQEGRREKLSTDNFEKVGKWYFSAKPGNELYGKRPQQAGRTQATPLFTTTTTTGTSTLPTVYDGYTRILATPARRILYATYDWQDEGRRDLPTGQDRKLPEVQRSGGGRSVLYIHDTEGNRHELLSIVDYSSAYHVVIPVDRKDTPHLERAFCEHWANIFGAPGVVTVDLENGLQKALARVGDWTGMRIKSAAGQTHWQAGFTERQGGIWKAVFARINEELSVTKEDIHLAISAVSGAKNSLTRANGYSPLQHVFGSAPRLPEDLLEGPHARAVGDEAIIDDKHAHEVALRTSARAAYHHVQTDERVRRALAGRARVQARRPAVGEQVFYFRKTKNAKRGMWMGPGTVIGEEGNNLWVSKGGRCVLCAEEHVRLATPEELGHAFSLRVAREDLEKLLGADPEDEETYEPEEGAGIGDFPDDLEELMADIEPSEPGEIAYDMDVEAEEQRGNRRDAGGLDPPVLRRKRRKGPPDGHHSGAVPHQVNMLKKAKTVRPLFLAAERKQWAEHLQHDALEVLDVNTSKRVRAEVPRERILSSRYAYRDKAMGKRKACPGTPWRAKARLVVGGHLDPDLGGGSFGGLVTDSPTINRSSLVMLLQLAVSLQMQMATGDVQAAFLNGLELERELFMEQPRGGVEGLDPLQLLRIKKGIFGLAESPRMWYDRLYQVLTEETFKIEDTEYRLRPCPLDPCVFLLQNDDCLQPKAYVGIHVDDLLVVAHEKYRLALQGRISELFPVDSWEEGEFDYIGSRVTMKDGVVQVNQSAFVEGRLFSIEVDKSQNGNQPATEEQVIDNKSLIGALSWLSSQSRPDIQCSVALAQQLQQCPLSDDVRFTNTTANRAAAHRDKGLTLYPVDLEKATIVVYHDAAWANAEHGRGGGPGGNDWGRSLHLGEAKAAQACEV
ncbi:Copia protein [Symbiodinium microadriaticum]|uniref:Copia protein n=1 Tax=Symbiodinium microadriaticum TaxID=2951 RepID=A0A1Q9DRI4_SYMMI|nr:Copia protein [Symbiodinium microadriaticum]